MLENTQLQLVQEDGFVYGGATENYSKKIGFRSNKLRHCVYVIYSVKTRFFKKTCYKEPNMPASLKLLEENIFKVSNMKKWSPIFIHYLT